MALAGVVWEEPFCRERDDAGVGAGGGGGVDVEGEGELRGRYDVGAEAGRHWGGESGDGGAGGERAEEEERGHICLFLSADKRPALDHSITRSTPPQIPPGQCCTYIPVDQLITLISWRCLDEMPKIDIRDSVRGG